MLNYSTSPPAHLAVFFHLKTFSNVPHDAFPGCRMSAGAMPNQAEQWRTSKLAEQPSELKDAISMWQGSPKVTLEALRNNPEADADAVAAVWTILPAMYPIPVGMVLWHAGKAGLAIDTVDWLPTSAVQEGAQYWADRNLRDVPQTVHKLIVGQGVGGVAVGSDDHYESEKEVLLQPGLRVKCLSGDNTWEVYMGQQG